MRPVKRYKDYCREAVIRDPKTYGHVFNLDGSLIPPPDMSFLNRKISCDMPQKELRKLKKDGWKMLEEDEEMEEEIEKPKPKVIKIKTKRIYKGNLTIIKMPKNISRKEYNKIWMRNARARQHINKLKKQ